MSQRPSTKSLLIGITLAVTINCILVCSSFTVGKIKLVSHEICFTKAFLQTLVYGTIKVISLIFKPNHQKNVIREEPINEELDSVAEVKLSAKLSLAFWVSTFSIATGTMTFTAYIGVKLIPIPDFVVLGHTASLFTLILSTLILKHKLTPLKVSLCLLVVTGVILVVQPSFIFGEKQNFINTTEYTQETSILPKLPEYNMTLGALISLVCALSAGFINVSAAKTKGISRVSLMIAGGIGTYLITFIGYFTMANSDGDNSAKVPLNERALLTVAVATASMIAGHLLVIANQNAPPTVVAVVRATEILLALIIDKLLFNARQTSVWHSIGAVLVLTGVTLMSCHMHIQDRIDDFFLSKKRIQMEAIKTECIDDPT